MATAAEHRAEIDRINGEVATQAAKIAQLSTMLDGKAAGGGGSVETCTIRMSANIPLEYFYGCYVIVTQCIDGNFVPSVYALYNPLLIENVVCGSAVALGSVSEQSYVPTLSDNMNFLECDGFSINNTLQIVAVKAPTEPNAIGELVIN